MLACIAIYPFFRRFSNLASSHLSLPSINSKIKALVQQGQFKEALQFYSRNSIFITSFSYPSLLKACASLLYLQHGKAIHSSIVGSGFCSDPYIVTSLINMYMKCGSLSDAVLVFDNLPEREVLAQDVTIWNAIIDGYFRFGRVREGIVQFCRMLSFGVRPDAYSLCILVGECDRQLGLAERKQIHGYALRNMYTNDAFVESALIDAYFKCGKPMYAWCLFKEVEDKKNVVVWNVMIGGFSDNGLWEKSLEFYLLAKNENVKPVSATLTSTLTACCQGEPASFGKQVHCDVIKTGFEDDPYVCTSLLTMYAKSKSVESTEKVFDQVPDKKIELWNAMISAYLGNGFAYESLAIYKQMRLCKIMPDSFTISNILSSSTMVGLYNFGRLIHTDLMKRPIDNNIAVLSALLTMYSKCGNCDDANLIFSTMKERDLVAWGSMISGFCQSRKYEEALDFFREMKANEEKPDSSVMASIINVCAGLENVYLGCIIHSLVIKTGLELDIFVGSSLLDMYSKCGFAEMAEHVFADMPFKNLVAWNSIISCYCRNGLPELSISMFPQIMQHGLYPDSISITSALAAISSVAALLKGKSLHGYLIRHGILIDLQVENTLIDMYIKCGNLKYAQYIFDNLSCKHLITWNSMIGGYGSHGQCLKAIRLFHEMRSSGITPDDVTFLCLLSSCNHSGLVDEGLNLFQLMRMEYEIEPRMEHYTNIVDLLGRAGRLEDAYTFIKNMSIDPDRSIWLSLLCCCRAHHNLELGELAADKLLKIEPSRASNYVQLLNLYGEAALWDKAANVLASMKEKGLKKRPGCSWIEVSSNVAVFYSGDCSSSRRFEIYEVLASLRRNMLRKACNYGSFEVFKNDKMEFCS